MLRYYVVTDDDIKLPFGCSDVTQSVTAAFEAEGRISVPETKPPIIPPSPDQLALAFAAALLTNPKMAESPEAAIAKAWWLVPEWYRGRGDYEATIAPMFFSGVTPGVINGDPVDPETWETKHEI